MSCTNLLYHIVYATSHRIDFDEAYLWRRDSAASFAGFLDFSVGVPRLGCASPGATFYRLLTQADCDSNDRV